MRRLLEYTGATMALIAAVLVMGLVAGFVEGLFEGSSTSSSPGDPSSAGVIDSDAFWSPDSRLIAFDRSDYGSADEKAAGASDVFVGGSDGGEVLRLTWTPYNETVLGWLSNPQRVVYSRRETPRGRTTLYALKLSGGAPAVLGEVRAGEELLALSHDARRALVGTPRLDPKRYALLDLARNTRRALPGIAGYFADGAWSRDDSMLAYVTDESIVILRGGRVVRHVPLGASDSALGGLAWSPDGRRLAYGSSWDDPSLLWLVRLEDGSRLRLAGGGDTNARYPIWSPDGSTIYYEHSSLGDHDGLRAMAPDGTGGRKITDDDWAGGGLFNFEGKGDRWLDQARISPDGTKIVYLVGERGAWKNWSLVGVMNADGSDKTPFPASL